MKQELILLVRKLKDMEEEMDQYIDTVPSDLRQVLFDNSYVNGMALQRDRLVEALFGDMADDIFWFLCEFKAGKTPGPHVILEDGTEFTFNYNEDYYKYLVFR